MLLGGAMSAARCSQAGWRGYGCIEVLWLDLSEGFGPGHGGAEAVVQAVWGRGCRLCGAEAMMPVGGRGHGACGRQRP